MTALYFIYQIKEIQGFWSIVRYCSQANKLYTLSRFMLRKNILSLPVVSVSKIYYNDMQNAGHDNTNGWMDNYKTS